MAFALPHRFCEKPVPTFSRDAHFCGRITFAKNRFPLFRVML
jgi:hypothetical protein